MSEKDIFDPDDITRGDMEKIAFHIEEYLDLLESVMIIPEEIMKDHGDKIRRGIEVSRKLVKKLKKGDRSVFLDEEEWNLIS